MTKPKSKPTGDAVLIALERELKQARAKWDALLKQQSKLENRERKLKPKAPDIITANVGCDPVRRPVYVPFESERALRKNWARWIEEASTDERRRALRGNLPVAVKEYRAWAAKCREAKKRSGLAALERRIAPVGGKVLRLERRIATMPASGIPGLAVKLRIAADILAAEHVQSDDDEGKWNLHGAFRDAERLAKGGQS